MDCFDFNTVYIIVNLIMFNLSMDLGLSDVCRAIYVTDQSAQSQSAVERNF